MFFSLYPSYFDQLENTHHSYVICELPRNQCVQWRHSEEKQKHQDTLLLDKNLPAKSYVVYGTISTRQPYTRTISINISQTPLRSHTLIFVGVTENISSTGEYLLHIYMKSRCSVLTMQNSSIRIIVK